MRSINNKVFILVTVLAVLIIFTELNAQDSDTGLPAPPDVSAAIEKQRTAPLIEKISPGIFRIGNIQIDKNDRSIAFPALINMDKGLLEYLLVSSGGKTHESLLRTRVKPYDLQIAFLLLGFEGTNKPVAYQGSPEVPSGEPLLMTVQYNDAGGRNFEITPEKWIVRIIDDKKKQINGIDWIYTGSMIVEGQFLAQADGSIAAIFHDPVSMIDNASEGGENDEIWYVKEGVVPPVGTPVTISIKAKE